MVYLLCDTNLIVDLCSEPDNYFNYLFMDEATYMHLPNLITLTLLRSDIKYNQEHISNGKFNEY